MQAKATGQSKFAYGQWLQEATFQILQIDLQELRNGEECLEMHW